MRKGFFTLVLGFILASSMTAQDKPNIVMIFIDDWAWAGTPIRMDESMANSMMPLLQMPNLEKFSSEGMKFRNAYSAAPQCSPSRVALQTGQSSPRNGFTVYMNNGGSDYYDPNPDYSKFPVIACVSDMTIDEDAVTIPEALKPLGYASAHIGKWHMRGHPDDEGYLVNDGATTNNEGNAKIADDPKLMFSVTEKGINFMEEQVKAKLPFYYEKLYNQMMSYFEEVGARIPKMNPDYDEKVYNKARYYDDRIKWGPFEGERPLEEDEVL